jgi:propionate catabolism operon transcriptional regulator
MSLNRRAAHPGGLPRLCFLSYPQIRQLAMPVLAEYAARAEIETVDAAFGDALTVARERLQAGTVDVFVSAGSNASLLRQSLSAPVATVQLTGFDIMQALIKASAFTARVGIVMFGQTIPELDAVRQLLNIEIRQHAYRSREEVRSAIENLKSAGFGVVVGPSLAVAMAEEAGLRGMLAYSLASIRQGFDDALELARVARLESGRYEQLNGVLHNLHEAVLAVDARERILVLNPAMQRLLGVDESTALGVELSTLAPSLSLADTLSKGLTERGVVQQHAGRDWVLSRTPMREAGKVVGAALTMVDARTIHEADNRLRIQQRRQQNTARHTFADLLGQSPSLMGAMATARRYAQTDLGVLLLGESGTGKELFAQAMHNESTRRGKPFMAVNCAAFPETLLEGELFGHEEGAFTGARRGGRRGLFEAAHTGTLFLDEIGDMPMTLQTRLLRVLQEREVTRLGANHAIPIDVRIIAATHQDLPAWVAQGRFRQDLYYRLNTLRLLLPPLRQRPEDIAPMFRALVARSLARLGVPIRRADALLPLMPSLAAYPWPGNVRELENACDRMAVGLAQFRTDDAVDLAAIRAECPEIFDPVPAQAAVRPSERRQRAQQALIDQGGNHARAAIQLGIGRTTLWRWLKSDA